MAVLKVEKREGTGKYVAFDLRKQGKIPGVYYGKKEGNINLAVPLKELMHMVENGERLIDLEMGGETMSAILKDLQHGTFEWEVQHVDFRAVSADTKLNVEVDVELAGESKGVAAGGILEQMLHSVPVECVPKNLPEKIVIRIDDIEIDTILHVSEMPKLDGVTYNLPDDTPVLSCHLPRGEEEAAEEGEEGSEPEVIGEKKEE